MVVGWLRKYLLNRKYRKEQGPEHKDMIFELAGKEGGAWDDLKVTEVSFNGKRRSHYIGKPLWKDDIIRYYVKVVGFSDIIAPKRNWGICLRKKPNKKEYEELLKNYLKLSKRSFI